MHLGYLRLGSDLDPNKTDSNSNSDSSFKILQLSTWEDGENRTEQVVALIGTFFRSI
jgi:hypothetical protein